MGLFSFLKKTPEKLEAAGDKYVEAKEFGLANIEYESALNLMEKKHPDDADMTGRVRSKLNDSREALARQHVESGRQLLEVNAMDEAGRLFELALSLTGDSELKQAIRELLGAAMGDMPEVVMQNQGIPEAEEARASYDDDQAFDVLCMTLPEDMARAYQSYGDTFKEGFIALGQGDFSRAADKFRAAMDEHPEEDSHIPVELATALIHLGQTDPAIDHLTRYLEHHPSSFHGISLLCDIYCDLKQFEQAHDVVGQSPGAIRDSVEGRRLDGRIYHIEGDHARAEKIFRDALAADEWDPDIARELAMTLAAAGKIKDAKDLYTDLLNQCSRCGQRINPLDKKAFADLSLELNDFSESVLNLYLGLASDHKELRPDCLNKASLIYSHNGNEKEAIRFKKLAEAAG